MSLFVCSKCGCIENTATCSNSELRTVYTAEIKDEDKFFPHMGRMDMDGHDDEDIIVNGKVWKRKDEIKVLCSECNDGVWHGEFNKEQATEDELKLAAYSKYNMVTPYDHDKGVIFSTRGTYKLSTQYDLIHTAFRKLFNKTHTDALSNFKKNYFALVYQVYLEDPMNFNFDLNYEDVDWKDSRAVMLYISGCLIYPETKSKIFRMLTGTNKSKFDAGTFLAGVTAMVGGTSEFGEYLNSFSKYGNKKQHWKDTQSEDEKNLKLMKAKEKRLRKAGKKNETHSKTI